LIRLENIQAALCMGYYAGAMYLSLRTIPSQRDAGILIQKTVSSIGKAGGHGTVAGGQVRLLERDTAEVAAELQVRFLEVMGEKSTAEPLIT